MSDEGVGSNQMKNVAIIIGAIAAIVVILIFISGYAESLGLGNIEFLKEIAEVFIFNE